jgi:hypothetical protein
MNQAVLADVKKPAAGGAVPIVWQALDKVTLKRVQMGEREKPSPKTKDSVIDPALLGIERL